jgi:hypothetical protein
MRGLEAAHLLNVFSRNRIRLKENLPYKQLTLNERILCVIYPPTKEFSAYVSRLIWWILIWWILVRRKRREQKYLQSQGRFRPKATL